MLLNVDLWGQNKWWVESEKPLGMILSPYEVCLLTHASLITFVSVGINHQAM